MIALDSAAIGRTFAVVDGPPPNRRKLAQGRGRGTSGAVSGGAVAVGVVEVTGVLAQRAERLCGWIDGYDSIADRIVESLSDQEVGGVVVKLDSPGGDVQGLEEAIRVIGAAQTASGKPIAVYVDELAASAGYWLASGIATAGIYGPPAALVGSIGVYMPIVDERGALEQAGVKVKLVRDPAGKDAGNPCDPVEDVALVEAQTIVTEAATRFYAAVGTRRDLTPDAVRGLNAQVFGAPAAASLKLLDGVKSFYEVLGIVADSSRIHKGTPQGRRKGNTMAGKKRSGLRAADEMAPEDGEEESSGRTTAAQAAEACRSCSDQCLACADACDGGTADEAIDAANLTIETLDKTKATLMAFLGKSEEVPAPAPEPAAADEPVEEEKQAALSIRQLAGKATLSSALSIIESWRNAAAEQGKFEATRKAAESVERNQLVAELVQLGVETPATAWKKSAAGVPDVSSPVSRLAGEPIEELRDRVEHMRAARGGRSYSNLSAPRGASLSARELAICAEFKLTPDQFAQLRQQQGR